MSVVNANTVSRGQAFHHITSDDILNKREWCGCGNKLDVWFFRTVWCIYTDQTHTQETINNVLKVKKQVTLDLHTCSLQRGAIYGDC